MFTTSTFNKLNVYIHVFLLFVFKAFDTFGKLNGGFLEKDYFTLLKKRYTEGIKILTKFSRIVFIFHD